MKKMKATMTYHAKVERIDRLSFIIDNIKGGFGEEYVSVPSKSDPKNATEILTTTGVIIVKNTHTHKIITAFVPDYDRALAIFRTSDKCYKNMKMPNWLEKVIKNNQAVLKKA